MVTNRKALAFIRARVDEARNLGKTIQVIRAPKACWKVLRREYPGVTLVETETGGPESRPAVKVSGSILFLGEHP